MPALLCVIFKFLDKHAHIHHTRLNKTCRKTHESHCIFYLHIGSTKIAGGQLYYCTQNSNTQREFFVGGQ